MHTVKIELTLPQADDVETQLLEIGNDLGRPLNFSLFRLPARAFLTGYFKTRPASLKQLALLRLPAPVHHGFLRDRDWQDSVKKHFKPLVYRRVAWLPAWQKKFDRRRADTIMRFDIGMAFGTGNHPTTRLCLRRLVELIEAASKNISKDKSKRKSERATRIIPNQKKQNSGPENLSVLDIGCGSGILAITADKLGVFRATGFDLDAHSIVVATRNARLNRSRASFNVRDLYKTKLPKADIVVANLLANLITDNAKKLWECVKPGGTLILSGLLKEELPQIAALFPAPAKPSILGKWGVLVLGKTPRRAS